MKTVLITGASGLMGSELALALLEKGFSVVGVDNTPGAYYVNCQYHFE